jgi:phosphatidylethanolamine/phosphatidyl-N-methylethanolamine N-methyltransferase
MSSHERAAVYEGGCYESLLFEGPIGRAVAVPHRQMESGVAGFFATVLELGAGSGHHRQYVRHRYDTYIETDISYEGSGSAYTETSEITIRREYADAHELPFDDQSVDRLVVTCLLAHLDDPEKALSDWRRVVRQGGLLSIYVPCEPGTALRAIRSMTTARKARRLGYEDYALTLAREHRNHAVGLERQLGHVFRNDSISTYRWPLPFRTWSLNLFTIYQVRRATGAGLGESTK